MVGYIHLAIASGIKGISNGAFEGWPSLEKVNIIYSATTIGNSEFSFSESLATVKHGNSAFEGCTKLICINFNGETSPTVKINQLLILLY